MNKFKFGDKVWHGVLGAGVIISDDNEMEFTVHFKKYPGDEFTCDYEDGVTPVSGWVKCSERMPEHGCYLVVSKNKEMNESFIGMEYFTHGAYRKNKFEEITHWMPLPALPQD